MTQKKTKRLTEIQFSTKDFISYIIRQKSLTLLSVNPTKWSNPLKQFVGNS